MLPFSFSERDLDLIQLEELWADQPTTRREKRSMTTDRYSQPSWVLM